MNHSKLFAPSSLSRRITCHLSAVLEPDIEDEQNEWGARGTACHHLFWLHFTEGTDPASYIGRTVLDVEIDQDMADATKQSIADAQTILAQYPDAAVSFEQEVSMTHHGHDDVFGTADMIIDSFLDTLIIFDEKYGQNIIDPDCDQLKAYALMAAGDALDGYSKIVLAISQPIKSSSLTTCELAPAELKEWYTDRFLPAYEAITGGDKTAVVTEDGCRYCKAKSQCSAYTAHALEIARTDFEGTVTAPVINDETVNLYYRQLGILKDWIKEVEQHAAEMARAGTLDGYKLVNGRSSRQWRNKEAAEQAITQAGFDAYEHKLLSPAKAEEIDAALKKNLKELIETIPGNPVIAPIGDKRKAIANAADDFKKLNN